MDFKEKDGFTDTKRTKTNFFSWKFFFILKFLSFEFDIN
jgi:hypothetical protein